MNKTGAVVLGVLGIIALVCAILYFSLPAHSLPSILPGHITGLNSSGHRNKRGVAALVVGIVLLGLAAVVARQPRPSTPS